MKLAHVSWLLSDTGGGIPPAIFGLASAHAAAGIDVRVVGVEDRAHSIPTVGVPIETHKPIGPLALGWAPGMRRSLAHWQPDVLHLHGLFTWPSAAVLAHGRRTGAPVVVAPHGMLQPWALARSAWKKRLFRFLVEDANLRSARCLHALNAQEAAAFRQFGLRNPIAVVPNGVLVPEQAPGDVEAFSRTFPAARARKTVLFLGRIHPKKGLPHLVQAWARVERERRLSAEEWMLVVAGPDQLGHTEQVRRCVCEAGLEHEVLFTGPLWGPAKQAALASASAFVLPSFSEGFSMAVLEAMAFRIPVLITRECNLDVEAIGAGLLAGPSADSVADQLRRFFSMSEQDRRLMGERGRSAVERTYSWRSVAGELNAVYRWLLHSEARPACVEVVE